MQGEETVHSLAHPSRREKSLGGCCSIKMKGGRCDRKRWAISGRYKRTGDPGKIYHASRKKKKASKVEAGGEEEKASPFGISFTLAVSKD